MKDLHDHEEEIRIGELPQGEYEFVAKPGQTDYTHIHYAPVVNCVLVYKDKILIVQRSQIVRFYPGYWNGLSGYLDDHRTVEEKARFEAYDEAGIKDENILDITEGEVFEQAEKAYKKVWVVHPVRIDVSTDKVIIGWEAQASEWVTLKDVKLYKTLPGFDKVLEALFPDGKI